MMRAIVYREYGGPEVLVFGRRERPEPGRGQVLLRVCASSINAGDYRVMRADPFLTRFMTGVMAPREGGSLGVDVAGVVEQLGPGVEDLEVGDAVFGDAFGSGGGAFAEYVVVDQSALVRKPQALSFAQAASLPTAGVTALQGVRDGAQVEEGEQVLVYGAGGGVGGFVVQIAQAYGARVTAVCGASSAARMAQMGVERVLDYRREDFRTEDQRYDVILGVNGYQRLRDYRAHLKEGGRYVMIGGQNRQIMEALVLGKLAFAMGGRQMRAVSVDYGRLREDLEQLARMCLAGQLEVSIDRRFALHDCAEAMRYVEQGHPQGKVVLEVA